MPPAQPIRLSELNGRISDVIRDAFSTVSYWVIADVTNHSFRSARQSHFFDLVEKSPDSQEIVAKIACKAWGNASGKIEAFERSTGQRFTNNINVLVCVSVQFHPVFGLQLNLSDVDPNFTLGRLEQQRQATLLRLAAENPGYITLSDGRFITQNNRLSLPAVVQRIAIISSQTSAGAEDFKHSLATNSFGYRFQVDEYNTLVQGESNAKAFVQKMIEVFQSGIVYDVVVIARGGGAQTDFLIFDDYNIARAVARFPVPVLTGIGHQKNETIADMMAHTALKTPTKAAEFIIAHNKSFEDRLRAMQQSIVIRSQQLFAVHRETLTGMKSIMVNRSRDLVAWSRDNLVDRHQAVINASRTMLFRHRTELVNQYTRLLSKPKIIVYNRIRDIEQVQGHLKSFNGKFLKNQQGHLAHFISLFRLMAPDNILKKGFAIVKTKNRITGNPDDIGIGEEIQVILAGSSITSTVTKKEKYDGSDFNV